MARRQFRDFGIRPRGSPEVSVDPCILSQIIQRKISEAASNKNRKMRAAEVFNFIIKVAMEILPPRQRRIFYSVWVRSGGRMSKGIMELSRRTKRSHYTEYNNYYKSLTSIQVYLERQGYWEHVLDYLHGGHEIGPEENVDDLL